MQTVLIANRGEIAVRVLRTCREMGLGTVAVYSDADATAPHVRMADRAVRLGPAPSNQSYLLVERVLDAARQTGADGIHPGYGFLSENADFAQACADAGIAFIGPSPDAIRAMGDKTAARALMERAGVPMAPGTTDAVASADEAQGVAREIGYPVLLKAAAGGGGKGMRIVERADDLESAFGAATREAHAAFGDGRVFVEKYIVQPRHIEIQVLGDTHGNVIHLHERECSIQRRHQKVIEEAPSSALGADLRARMGEAAVRAARTVGYFSAGTVEFLLGSDGQFYFMEMNTRLQVEHPVTEMITGVDLVREQIRIARGERLSLTQEQVPLRGHAIECRVYAEDAAAGFLPAPGPLLLHRPPSGPGVRVDAGVEEGGEVPVHYDPMISKLSTWGADREQATNRMARALDEYAIAGVETTIGFCRWTMGHPAWRAGELSTHFVGDHFTPDALAPDASTRYAAVLAAALLGSASEPARVHAPPAARSRWRERARP
jgi:propionyl-CoA carboxylase alpha chain